jgi:Na+-transporting NADH:ubiquinone oxidoreductase subunit NqrF
MAAREADGRREQQRERVSVGCPGGTTTARATAAARLLTYGRGGRARRRRHGLDDRRSARSERELSSGLDLTIKT